MYYYIFDIKKCKKRTLVDDIKNYLSTLGISGEFAYPSAAYTTEELVDLGLSKKYNTIVGIGGDEIANKIAAKLCGNSAALGIIPLEASSDLEDLIGAKNWKEAAENLRFRKINEIKIGKTANGSAFLTNLSLDLKIPTEVTIEFKDFLVQAKASALTISNFNPTIEKIGPDYLDLILESVDPHDSAILSKISLFFGGKKNENANMSLFRGRSLRLFTNTQVPLTAGGEIIAKTPQLIETSDDNLRLIVGKKSLYKCQE